MEPSTADLRARFRDHLAELAAEVDRVRQDGEFRRALDTMARFWRYSPLNQWLVTRVRPDAARVAGRRLWETLGRSVSDGEAPIHILAPMARGGFPFRLVEVFDLAQTTGAPLPTLDLALRGRTRKVARLERAAAALGVRVVEQAHPGLAGVSLGGVVHLAPGQSSQDRAAVLAHELAHELLHQGDEKRARSHAEEETEAEAVSYVVLRALGLPSKAPTYIAWRGGTGKRIARSLRRIQQAARRILEAGAVTARAARASNAHA